MSVGYSSVEDGDAMVENKTAITYEIIVDGHLDRRWVEWFGNMSMEHTTAGATTLTGKLADQAALYRVLLKICDLGITLVSVRRIDGSPQK